MLFNSLTFIVFFAIVLLLHYMPFSWRQKKFNLLLASYLFYAAWNPPFVILLWISTLVDWHVAKWLYVEKVQSRRRLLLVLSLATNLGILGFFKYGDFLLHNWQAFMGLFGIDYQVPDWSIILPVGISFYTFQTMAYSLDIYLNRAKPAKNFLDFALFVTFFPQLVAGPIVRPTHLIPQFEKARKATKSMFIWGLGLITLGMFQKVVIADGALAPASDAVFGSDAVLSFSDAWLGTLAFAGQIFSDFAGYSTTAIGVGLTLGFSLPTNFRFPYAAIGFSDFWRRWHISLSTWLRDYLYIPLGGNKRGPVRTYINLMATMLLGGLWHGASWTFVVWGGLHGLYLAVERWLKATFKGAQIAKTILFRIFLALVTYFFINITWVFFRAQSFDKAFSMVKSMFGFNPDGTNVLATVYIVQVLVVTIAMVAIHWRMRDTSVEAVVQKAPWPLVGVVWGLMLFFIIITQGGGDAFIYFQF
ncbi:MBOAT family O-acyltransferase [Porticoccus sp. W117]|uniref:MBOAT family O-acyltransferase n=1 Tax=Porticoccus sp. W117 TaxID=3054777 RepID=UPI002591D3BD|nr:MBOAT family O-acyltransferase [Porticoccus sp. W117]MDM3871047.1 MBOAT family O-acyltransferase [Porticoccus sp. W117]